MLVRIPAVLPRAEAKEIAAALAAERFVDGASSAGGTARGVKRNEEVAPESPRAAEFRRRITEQLWRNELFATLAMPKRITALLFSRYEPGMTYGDHIDNTIMNLAAGDPIRADISMTLFLADPDDYEGGALVIESDTAPQPVKLPAGDAVLYPTTGYHRVDPVTRGVRRVAVGWVQSMVRDAQRRQILTEMWVALDWMHRRLPPGRAHEDASFERLKKARANLYRLWAEV